MEKFFGRHKFRVSVRRKLESLGSDFLGFLVVRTGRIVVFPRKKCMLLCHFMLLICLPPSKLQFSSQLTGRCASSIERTGDLLPMKMHLVFPHGINVEYVCCFLSWRYVSIERRMVFLSISTVQISEASTVLTVEIMWSCWLCELQKLFTIDGNNSWSTSFQALNLIRWLVLLFYSPSPKTICLKYGIFESSENGGLFF